MRRWTFLMAFAAIVCLAAASVGSAASYPLRPIRLLIPAAPGGSTDIAGRTLASVIDKHLGQTFVPVNMPGAGGSVACTELANSRADGYTLLLHHTMIATSHYSGVSPYNYKSFSPVARIGFLNQVIAVNANSPYRTVRDVQARAKAEPGKVLYAMETGGTSHFIGLSLASALGVDIKIVDMGTGAQRLAALQGGHVDLAAEGFSSFLPHAQAGRLRILGVLNDERDPLVPDVPTFKEQGWDIRFPLTWCIYAPKGTDPAIVETVNKAIGAALRDPSVIEKFKAMYVHPAYLSVADTLKYLADEDAGIAERAKAVFGK